MSGRSRVKVVGSVVLATAAAEAARRLLTPRSAVLAPAPVDVGDYFSAAEVGRAAGALRARSGRSASPPS